MREAFSQKVIDRCKALEKELEEEKTKNQNAIYASSDDDLEAKGTVKVESGGAEVTQQISMAHQAPGSPSRQLWGRRIKSSEALILEADSSVQTDEVDLWVRNHDFIQVTNRSPPRACLVRRSMS
jgi:hypothetical protein